MHKTIVFLVAFLFLLILCSCQNLDSVQNDETAIPSCVDKQIDTPTPADKQIAVNGKEFSVEQINEEIKKVLNGILYYHGNDPESPYLPNNSSLLLNKTVEYDLFFYASGGGFASSKPKIFLTITNIVHPQSADEETFLYELGFYATEYGLSSDFCYMAHISQEEHDNAIRYGAVFLGSYCMRIDEILPPLHEQMSDEWLAAAKGALCRYMDENNFYSEAEYNLQPGKYHVYVQGFSKSDEDSTVIFEHENGSVYSGRYYFVHSVIPGELADLNKVELVEDADTASFQSYMERVRQNAALTMEYSVQDKTA